VLTARAPRLALALALSVTAATGVAAHAEKAPKTGDKSSTFFLRQDGCGAETGPGRLEPKAGTDGSTGCGTIGGLPFDELFGSPEPFATSGKGLPINLDPTRKVTGQLAAGSWVGNGAGGIGEVAFDVALVGTTASGSKVDFGETTVTGSAAPGEDVVMVPFELAAPAVTGSTVLKSLVLEVTQRGANLGMSAKQFDGDSYVVIPTRSAGKKK
jgi:hypothetical protein